MRSDCADAPKVTRTAGMIPYALPRMIPPAPKNVGQRPRFAKINDVAAPAANKASDTNSAVMIQVPRSALASEWHLPLSEIQQELRQTTPGEPTPPSGR